MPALSVVTNQNYEYIDRHKEKNINPADIVSIELITSNSYSSDLIHGSIGWVSPEQVNHSTNFNKSSINSKSENNLDGEQSINIDQSCITPKYFTSGKNITDISDSNSEINYTYNDILRDKEIQLDGTGIIAQHDSWKNIKINVCTIKKMKKIYSEGKSVNVNSCILNKKCQHKCWDKFTENDRKNLFDEFWKLGNKSRQCDYLEKCVHRGPVQRKRIKGNSRRTISYKYYLSHVLEEKQVCQQFLLSTLDISQKRLIYTIKKCYIKKMNILEA